MRSLAARCCLLILIATSGCGKPAADLQLDTPPDPESGPVAWPYWPVDMRVHPLTRLAVDPATGGQVIEVRVELFDPTDDPTKGVGQLQLDLHEVTGAGTSAEPVATWIKDLRDLANNRLHFDVVTRTYLFRLEIEPSQLPDEAELRAYFLSVDGRQLRGELQLRMTGR